MSKEIVNLIFSFHYNYDIGTIEKVLINKESQENEFDTMIN